MEAHTQTWEDQSVCGIHPLGYNFWGLFLSSLFCLLAKLPIQTHGTQEASPVSFHHLSRGLERTDLGWNVGTVFSRET